MGTKKVKEYFISYRVGDFKSDVIYVAYSAAQALDDFKRFHETESGDKLEIIKFYEV